MNLQAKIYSYVLALLAVSAFAFFYLFPMLANGLIQLQNTHKDQLSKIKSLDEQVKALQAMQRNLDDIAKMPVQPKDLFAPYSADVTLVDEIQSLENSAVKTNNTMKITINGSAQGAQPYPSASGLVSIPYIINLNGTYPQTVRFLEYLENSFFISPVQQITISRNGDKAGTVNTKITTMFFLQK